jgi:thiol-disulfide isomerase/thioredoxin
MGAWVAAGLLGIVGLAAAPRLIAARGDEPPWPAPAFPTNDRKAWIGEPASWKDLAGRVVMIEVWTFECINCRRTIPFVRAARERHAAEGLAVVGIHSPEFDSERDPAAVRRAVAEHGLDYPHLLDNDFRYWRALGNEYWPTTYLVDRCGRIRHRQIGEVHDGQPSGRAVEEHLQQLLAETAADCKG